MEGTFYTYIARCSDDSFYIGITNDLTEREKRHNQGVGSIYTKNRRPIVIVYSESYTTRAEAAQREKQLKGWSKKKKENLITFGHPKGNYFKHT